MSQLKMLWSALLFKRSLIFSVAKGCEKENNLQPKWI